MYSPGLSCGVHGSIRSSPARVLISCGPLTLYGPRIFLSGVRWQLAQVMPTASFSFGRAFGRAFGLAHFAKPGVNSTGGVKTREYRPVQQAPLSWTGDFPRVGTAAVGVEGHEILCQLIISSLNCLLGKVSRSSCRHYMQWPMANDSRSDCNAGCRNI